MTHHMHLKKEPFDKIWNGKKTIELRLFDEKRKMIACGDTVVFESCEKREKTVTARVLMLHVFDSFKELYENLPLEKCGYSTREIEKASHTDMEAYYPREEQKKYGVVGIEFELLEKEKHHMI